VGKDLLPNPAGPVRVQRARKLDVLGLSAAPLLSALSGGESKRQLAPESDISHRHEPVTTAASATVKASLAYALVIQLGGSSPSGDSTAEGINNAWFGACPASDERRGSQVRTSSIPHLPEPIMPETGRFPPPDEQGGSRARASTSSHLPEPIVPGTGPFPSLMGEKEARYGAAVPLYPEPTVPEMGLVPPLTSKGGARYESAPHLTFPSKVVPGMGLVLPLTSEEEAR
jgi:hypothetical protein